MTVAYHSIDAAALDSKPEVLDTDDLVDVLRMNARDVRDLVNAGRLRRLAYSRREIRVWREEVRRFLADQTDGALTDPERDSGCAS
jgi:hypothetical protein